MNIECEKNDKGEAVALEYNNTYTISGSMVAYGVTLSGYRDSCSHPVPPEGEGLATMTVEKDLNVKNVSVKADGASAEAYDLEATGENSSVTVKGVTTITGISATTESGSETSTSIGSVRRA